MEKNVCTKMNTKYRKNTIRISIKSGKKGQTTHAFIQLNGWGPVCVSERPVVAIVRGILNERGNPKPTRWTTRRTDRRTFLLLPSSALSRRHD